MSGCGKTCLCYVFVTWLIQLIIHHLEWYWWFIHLSTGNKMQRNSKQKINNFHNRNWICKCRQQNSGYFAGLNRLTKRLYWFVVWLDVKKLEPMMTKFHDAIWRHKDNLINELLFMTRHQMVLSGEIKDIYKDKGINSRGHSRRVKRIKSILVYRVLISIPSEFLVF